MKNLSVESLKAKGACKEGISFVKNFGLDKYNFEDLVIEGDHENFVDWFETTMNADVIEKPVYEDCKVFKNSIVRDSEEQLEELKSFSDYWFMETYDRRGNRIRYESSDGYLRTHEYITEDLHEDTLLIVKTNDEVTMTIKLK